MLALLTWVAALGGWLVALVLWREGIARAQSIARACHELRGPLAAIGLGLHLAGKASTTAAGRIRAIDLELGRVALALADLERAGDGRGATSFTPRVCERLDAYALMADSVEALRATAERHGAVLCLARGGSPTFVLGDRLRIAQAIGNLIANAIEHGGGRVEVRIARTRATARIEVIDEGPGLPAPVTELVRRARHGRGRHGHGLAIASAIAQAHGGRLAAAPTDAGARLAIELPAVGDGSEVQAPGS
jgi:signal transduction histidine kinase